MGLITLKTWLITWLLLFVVGTAAAQDTPSLTVESVDVVMTQDIYGQNVFSAEGVLLNEGDDAYTNITLRVEAYSPDDALIGEGIGVMVNACGAGLLFDFALQPGESHAFAAPIELFEMGQRVERVEVFPDATPTNPAPSEAELPEGITQIAADQEVIALEWTEAPAFRYATGCTRDLFTDWTWYDYDPSTGESAQIEHPRAAEVTEELRTNLDLADPLIFANSALRFAPDGTRLVYQDALNAVWTAAPDGRLLRRLYDRLNNRTWQGIHWLPEGRFLAYYYGAFGDPVIYFTADVEGRYISPPPLQLPPSLTVPGVSLDGRRVVITGDFADRPEGGTMGYYIYVLTNNFFERLFEAEPPGNNYPAPVPILSEAGDRVTLVYLALEVDGEARFQCFNRDDATLHDLAPLPLNLADDERGWFTLAPDGQTLALHANGANGGLWLLDLPPCEG
jgi:hypothetical protein